MLKAYGPGSMILESKGIFDLFLTEVVRPLYFFIVMSCVLWSLEQYWSYGMLIFVTALGGILTNLYQTYKLNQKIHEMAYYETNVNVLRNGMISEISSKYIVPGDVVFIKNSMKMPFDGVLLQGSVLMN
jgi:cation-transporting ATPase 13A2